MKLDYVSFINKKYVFNLETDYKNNSSETISTNVLWIFMDADWIDCMILFKLLRVMFVSWFITYNVSRRFDKWYIIIFRSLWLKLLLKVGIDLLKYQKCSKSVSTYIFHWKKSSDIDGVVSGKVCRHFWNISDIPKSLYPPS